MDTLLQDLRYAGRTLRRSPGFALMAVLCLAVGIGMNTAMFSVVHAILLRELPFAQAERVVALHASNERAGVREWSLSYADLRDLEEASGVFEQVAAHAGRSFTLSGGEETERVQGGAVTPNLFPLIGVQPLLGRGFEAGDEARTGFESVVLISHTLWRRRFGADPEIVGKPIHVNGRELTVVGVMPAQFKFPERDELWVPLGASRTDPRTHRYLRPFARLKPGVSLEQAQRAVATATARLAEAYPESNRDWQVQVLSFRDAMVDANAQRLLFVMLGAVGFVLLIACANVANLLLARGTARRRELAVRAALGARRARLIRQLLTESTLIGLAAGALGLWIAVLWVEAMVVVIPEELPYWIQFGLDARVLLYTLGLSLVSGLLFGSLPAVRASRGDLQETLMEGGRGGSGGRRGHRLRSALVVGEIALALVLLAGASLMVQSFLRLQSADAGFDTRNLLTMRLALAGDRYDAHGGRASFYLEAVERLAALPGVRAAAATSSLPIDDGGMPIGIVAEGQPRLPGEELMATAVSSTPGLFATLGVPLLAGRDFTPQEAADTLGTSVLVNRALAERLWPGEDPIGRRVHLDHLAETPWLTVIGVAPDLQYEEFGEDTPQSRLQIHLPYARFSWRNLALLVRGAADPAALAPLVRQELRALDPLVAAYEVRTMDEVRRVTTWEQRLFGQMFGVFAGVSLLLAALGIYGVMAYTVAQRVREIGIRMALGALPGDVLRLVVGDGAALTGLGITLGLVGAYQLTRLLGGLLFQVAPTDPLTFLVTPLLLGAVALLASYLPARRATRVDPMVALRAE